MVVGTLKIILHLHDNRSLKGKRKVVRSMVDKVKHKFNVSIAEVEWQRIELGVSAVGNDRRHIDSSLNNILDYMDTLYLAEIVDSSVEIYNV
jgi:uncharacterized protein YlxP (DUF503 family)